MRSKERVTEWERTEGEKDRGVQAPFSLKSSVRHRTAATLVTAVPCV